MRLLQNERRGLPENHYVVRVVLFGTVENGGIPRLVNKGGGGIRHFPGKTVGGLSHSLRLFPTCLLPHRGLVFGAIIGGAFAWTGRVCGSRNFTGRGRRLPTGSPWLGRRDIRHIGGEHLVCVHINGVVGTTRAVHGVCSFRSPRRDSSG